MPKEAFSTPEELMEGLQGAFGVTSVAQTGVGRAGGSGGAGLCTLSRFSARSRPAQKTKAAWRLFLGEGEGGGAGRGSFLLLASREFSTLVSNSMANLGAWMGGVTELSPA